MNTKQFTAAKFGWLDRVACDHGLLAVDVRVAAKLLPFFNDGGAGAFPALNTIADAIGVSKPTVIRAVRRLHARGHLKIEWGQQGRGRPNRYWMSGETKGTPVYLSEAVKGTSRANKRYTGVPEPLREPSRERQALTELPLSLVERDAPNGACRSGGGLAGADAPPAAEAAPEGAQILDGEILPPESASEDRPTALDQEQAWRELRGVIWARGHVADGAAAIVAHTRAAFARACTHTTPEAILAGARAWRAAANAAGFLPRLSVWLDGNGWQKPPPKRARQFHRGGKRRARNGKPTAAELMAALGRGG